eukprot:TRINITY_DN3324_c0_g1_i1.p1 TRINITY_DN3324_c0_g1~~TRINITY_DN3324_c0_g1_i1.p1  ORF type:complete len:534 (+),score=165.99 TRINITY_DN3324_c0_g1_i1:96-1697(+)
MSEISMMSMDPTTTTNCYPFIGLDQSGNEITSDFSSQQQHHQNQHSVWGDKDISALLNFDFTPTTTYVDPNPNYFYFSSPTSSADSPVASPPSGSVSPFSIPSPVDNTSESTLYNPHQHTYLHHQSPANNDTQLHMVPEAQLNLDARLFEEINPLLLPELEKILASTDSSLHLSHHHHDVGSPSSSGQPSTPPSSSNSRKRVRDDTILLPREELLTMTSQEIEDYVAEVKAAKNLTASEEKDLKRQRRLVKNREYASQSRTRRKQHMDDVEKQLEAARYEIDSLKRQNTTLVEENSTLKKQLSSIAATIKRQILSNSTSGRASLASSTNNAQVNSQQQGRLSPATTPYMATAAMEEGAGNNNNNNATAMPYGFDVNGIVSTATEVYHRATSVGKSVTGGGAAKTVSVCMLAILFMVFTFGSFWTNDQCGVNSLLPSNSPSWNLRDVRSGFDIEASTSSLLSSSDSPSPSSSVTNNHLASSSSSPSSDSSSASVICSYDPNFMFLESAWRAAVCMASNYTKAGGNTAHTTEDKS